MASVNQLSAAVSSMTVADSQGTPRQSPLVPSNEPIRPRIDDFMKEPLDDGNRNVVLPDKSSNEVAAVKMSCERMKKEIEKASNAFKQTEKDDSGTTSK